MPVCGYAGMRVRLRMVMTPRACSVPTRGTVKHSLFGLAQPKNECFMPPWGPETFGTKCFRNFSISNDLFTTMFTAQMGRGKIQWGVITSRRRIRDNYNHITYLT
jgi:hypothetical protein